MNALFCWIRGIFISVAIAVAASPATAAIMRDDVPSSAYEAFFKDPIFQSVGWLAGMNGNGTAVAGSAVLIAPDWVLTAAHVIDSPSRGMYDQMWFSLSDSIYAEPPNYTAADKLFVYPGWKNDGTVGNDVDLGLIHLTTPITSVTPATRFYGTDQRGTLMMTAGFGRPGTVSSGLGAPDGIGRAGSVLAEWFGGDPFSFTDEEQYWNARFRLPPDSLAQPLEWLTSPGDSGGAWFADILGTGSYELVGLNSFNDGGYDRFGLSGAVRISMFNDWIDTTIAQNSVPEPSSFLCMSIAIASFGSRALRRRRARI